MRIIIDYIDDKAQTEIKSFICDIAPQVGDLAYVPDAEGIFTDAKVVSRTFDFTRADAVLRVGVSPLKAKPAE